MVGAAAGEHVSNHGVDAFGIGHDVVVGEPQHLKAAAMKVVVAHSVVRLGDFACMGIAIELDDQASMQAGEINNVASDLHLLAEMEATRAEWEEQAPEATLRRRRLAAKLLGKGRRA